MSIDTITGLPLFFTGTELINQSQYDWFRDEISGLADDAFIEMPSDWAANNRYLPEEVTEHYGYFDKGEMKYAADILDHVHPDDPTTHIAVIKSVQSGLTVSLGENAMGFYTKYRLGSVAFFTSTKNVGKTRSSSALDVMIDNSGLADLLQPMSNRTNRKSADTTFAKEFQGGIRWQISSYSSVADMKSNTFGLLICDEWVEAGPEMKGQGDVAGIIEGRTLAVRTYKILYISTPEEATSCRITKAFREGNQCRYFIPCPHCGHEQYLKFKFKKDKSGLTFSMKKNEVTGARELDPTSVRYICAGCEKPFYQHHKNDAIKKGEWRPTWQDTEYVPKSPNHKSYHIPGMLSRFLPWARICQKFIDTRLGKDILAFKDFVINVLGEPWERTQSSASWETLKNRADDYVMGTVPQGALKIYGSVDVQGDRLEHGVYGFGKSGERWLIDLQIFYGKPSDENDKCWDNLAKFAETKTYTVEGFQLPIAKVAIDVGYDPRNSRGKDKDWDSKSNTVYNFVAKHSAKFIAIKGAGHNPNGMILQERRTQHQKVTKRYDVGTSVLKELLLELTIDLAEGPNAMHFPKWRNIEGVRVPTGDEIFQQYISEKKVEVDGVWSWKKTRDRNEILDLTNYAIAAFYSDDLHHWEDHHWDAWREGLRAAANKK